MNNRLEINCYNEPIQSTGVNTRMEDFYNTLDVNPAGSIHRKGSGMKIFISGVMQGSIKGAGIQEQGYRQRITGIIKNSHPEIEIVDPILMFPGSVGFSEEKAKEVLFHLVATAAEADMIVAYLPEASMGSAMEMLRAFDQGKPIVTISPMNKNWFLLAVSDLIFPSFEALEEWFRQTDLQAWVSARN